MKIKVEKNTTRNATKVDVAISDLILNINSKEGKGWFISYNHPRTGEWTILTRRLFRSYSEAEAFVKHHYKHAVIANELPF